MTTSILLNSRNPCFSIFADTNLSQQLLNVGIVTFNDLVQISSTCRTLRVGFASYKNWQLHILKHMIILKTYGTNPGTRDYLTYKEFIYRLEGKKEHALQRALILTEAVVSKYLNRSNNFNDQTLERFNRTVQRQSQKKLYEIDHVFALINFLPDEQFRSATLQMIGRAIVNLDCTNALPSAIELIREYPHAMRDSDTLNILLEKLILEDGPDSFGRCIELIDSCPSLDKDIYLGRLAVVQAKRDHPQAIEEALETVKLLERTNNLPNILSEVAQLQAEKNSEDAIPKALKIASRISDNTQENALIHIALARARKSDPEAIEAALSMANWTHIDSLLAEIAVIRAQKNDPNRFSDALKLVGTISKISDKDRALTCLAKERAKQADENAIEEALKIANLISSKSSLQFTLVQIATEEAKKENPRAFSSSLLKVISYSDTHPKNNAAESISLTRLKKYDANALSCAMAITSISMGYKSKNSALYKLAENCTYAHLPTNIPPMEFIQTLHNLVHPPYRTINRSELCKFDLQFSINPSDDDASTSENNGKRKKTK